MSTLTEDAADCRNCNGNRSYTIMTLLKFDPATGTEKPYPSHPDQYRQHHGNVAWLFDPYTGKQRDPRDVGSDTFGLLLQEVAQTATVASTPSLEWSHTLLDGKRVTYAEAEKAVAELGQDWRLPTRAELISIQDISRHDPCIDTEKFPDTQSCSYWSSTPCAWNASAVWVVGFGRGFVNGDFRSGIACVRAVRASQ